MLTRRLLLHWEIFFRIRRFGTGFSRFQCRLHTGGRIRNKNVPFWSRAGDFEFGILFIRTVLNPHFFFRLNEATMNPVISPPTFLRVCDKNKMADVAQVAVT